jgi:YidC/Oxa1 family membrane protein insertase
MLIANVLQPLIDACEAILRFWHDTIGDFEGSWGVSIILLTFTVRIAILPLTFKGVKSMNELQRLQPELKKIQERYKEDRQRMNQEIMRFYQEHKVNPLGSCFPLLLQIPFFIALFYLLRSDSFQRDIADNQSFLFIDDLASKVTGDPAVLITLIVLYIGTQLAATMVTAISADPMQRRIMLALPFVFTIFIINFEAGLIVYWITTNVWTIGQQLLVRKLYPKPPPIGSEEAAAGGTGGKPARGKPPSPAPSGAAAVADGNPAKEKKKEKAGAATGASATGTRAKPPPPPRKKKKRSGRRR